MSNTLENQAACFSLAKSISFLKDNFSSLHLQFPHREYFALDKPLAKKDVSNLNVQIHF